MGVDTRDENFTLKGRSKTHPHKSVSTYGSRDCETTPKVGRVEGSLTSRVSYITIVDILSTLRIGGNKKRRN